MRTPFSIYQQRQTASRAEERRLRRARNLKPNEHAADADGNAGTPETLTPRRTNSPTHGWLLAEAPRILRLAA